MTAGGGGNVETASVMTEPPQNSFRRIAGVLFAPAETFRPIAQRPDVIRPLLVLLVISIVVSVILVPRLDIESTMRQQMEQGGRKMAEADMERAMRFGAAFGRVMGYLAPLWSAITYVVVAGVLLLAFRLLGGDGRFKQAFSVTLYSFMPMAIASIVLMIVAASRESIDPTAVGTLVKSNLAFLADATQQPVLFSLLASLDVFTIWTLALLTLGFAAVSNFSRLKSAAVVFSLWGGWIVVKLAFAAIGQAVSA